MELLGSVADLLNPDKAAAAAPTDAPGSRSTAAAEESYEIGAFDQVRTLGHGAFGRVKLIKHKTSAKCYALKCQSKSAIVNNCLQDHILMEKTILEMLDHPFILKLFSSMQDDRYIYFVLELLQGGELFTWLRKSGRFDEKDSKFFGAQVVLGFWHMHTKKVAYRDLKPENLVLDGRATSRSSTSGSPKSSTGRPGRSAARPTTSRPRSS